MASYVHFPAKIRLFCDIPWTEKDTGRSWNPRTYGFSPITDPRNKSEFMRTERGVHAETIRLWCKDNGPIPDPSSIERMLDFIKKHLDMTFAPIAVSDFTDTVTVENFCEKIGRSDFIELAYRSRFIREGPQNNYIYKYDERFENLNRSLRGKYYLYRLDKSKTRNRTSVTRCGIVIFGPVPITERVKESRYAIMAQLSVPSLLYSDRLPFIYTGAVGNKNNLTSWEFLQEDGTYKDSFHILTDKGNANRQDLQRIGHGITMAQANSTLSKAFKVVIRRFSAELKWVDASSFLVDAARFKIKEDKTIRELLEQE